MANENDRTTASSGQLAQAHNTFRRQLRQLRSDLGTKEAAGDDLLTHCLAFCSALTEHHVGEDEGMFVELLRARPDLETVVANLVQDHRMIAALDSGVRDTGWAEPVLGNARGAPARVALESRA